MKKIWLILLLLYFAAPLNAQKQFVVDANAEMRSLSGSFNSINVSGGIDLYLSQSDQPALAISASDDKYKDRIKTVIENNTLRIYFDSEKQWNMRNKQLKAYVSFTDIEMLEASGASDITVAGEIKSGTLVLKLSGASDFKGNIAVNALRLNLSGASDISISGSASIVNIESSGASDVKAYDLTAEVCTAKASGASDVQITVNKELNAHASGASNIYFKGEAVIKEMESSGASNVSKRNR